MCAKFNTAKSEKASSNGGKKEATAPDQDPSGAELLAHAKELGNQAMQEELRRANQSRDALLAFLLDRLQNIRQAQLAEAALLNQRDRWFISVHKGTEKLPDPARWIPCAKSYKEAASALCRGDIEQALHKIEQADKEAQSASATAPNALEKANPTSSPLPRVDGIVFAASRCNLPQTFAVADEIINLNPHVAEASTRKKRLHDWLGPEEEEEEEEESAD